MKRERDEWSGVERYEERGRGVWQLQGGRREKVRGDERVNRNRIRKGKVGRDDGDWRRE